MRKLLGWVVLFGGVGALGYLAPTTHMAGIQESLRGAAQGVAQSARHDVQVSVSGRDVQVSGIVNDSEERALLKAGFEDIDGVRRVDMQGVEALPAADPYEMTFTTGDGISRLSGVIPSEEARSTFGGFGPKLTLSAGVPDENWVAVAFLGIGAMDGLEQGEMILSGRTMRVTGLARTPAEVEETRRILSILPEGYSYTLDIDVEDDGTPLRLGFSLRDGILSGAGKLPAEMATSEVRNRFTIDDTDPIDITQSTLVADDPQWPDAARLGLEALANLIDGELTVENKTLTLNGAGTPDGKLQAEALIASVPDSYAVTSNLILWDDGTPLELSMDWDGTRATATGKLPAGFTPNAPAELAIVDDARRSFRSDDAGDFTRNADAGAAALGLLRTGLVIVSQSAITLSGNATTPQIEFALDDVFSDLPDTTVITREITYLDDGSPAAWVLEYLADTGATVQGRLPSGMALQAIADTLGVAVSGDPSTALTDTDSTGGIDVLAIASTYLPELEQLTYAHNEDGNTLDLIVSPGVDVDLVAVDLAERLPPDVAFSISPLETLPEDGASRRNAATGLSEIFTRGFWLPNLDFTPDPQGCTTQTDALLARAKIAFLSGSAQLDATSIRAINGLAAVAQICANADLVLEIGGHTDATGSEDDNQDLSFARATAVLDALLERGLPRSSMIAAGYGSSQPIAENDTDDGRAANRRTTLIFTDPLTP